VSLSSLTDPWIGYGRFRLINGNNTAITASVQAAWLQMGEDCQSLVSVTVFDIDEERTVDPEGFQIAASETKTFLLGFPRVVYGARSDQSLAVGLRLTISGSELQALSPIHFVRRIPRRS
jgi:hypothetical protein